MTAINIPEKIDKLFDGLALEKNQAKDDLIVAALREYLENQADLKAAEAALAAVASGEEGFSTLDEVVRRLGLDD